jgi:hypothetical protein
MIGQAVLREAMTAAARVFVLVVLCGLASRPASADAPSPSSSPSPGAAQTPDEKREHLDRQLDKSLSEFDAMLLKEQQAAAAKRAEEAREAGGNGTGEGGEGEGDGSGSGGGGGEKGDGKGGTRSTSARDRSRAGSGGTDREGHEGSAGREGTAGSDRTADGRSKDGTQDRSTGSSRGGSRPGGRTTTSGPEGQPSVDSDDASVPIPHDVGDGRDDDVVARQIREAAMKEEDPAIREKLWDEYRRYKGIRSGGN